jgi:hypothetical protein
MVAANPVHNRVRIDFKDQVNHLDRLINVAKLNDHDLKTRVAHDTLLAKRAVLASLVSHSGSGTLPAYKNMMARDYKRRAYYPTRFFVLFDNAMAIAIMEA